MKGRGRRTKFSFFTVTYSLSFSSERNSFILPIFIFISTISPPSLFFLPSPGFMIIDEDTRFVVLEGLAGPGFGMQSVYMEIPRMRENDKNFKMLCNPEILFSTRLYPSFGLVIDNSN